MLYLYLGGVSEETKSAERARAVKGEPNLMPIYEYRCKACGYVFEMLRGVKEKDDEIACPTCRKQGVQKLLSLFSSSGGTSQESSCSPGPIS